MFSETISTPLSLHNSSSELQHKYLCVWGGGVVWCGVCVVYFAAFTFFPYQINWLLYKFYIKTVLEKKRREEKNAFFFFPDSTHYMIPFDLCLHFFLSTKIFILSFICTGDSFPRYDIDEGRGFCAYPVDASRRLITFGQAEEEMWNLSIPWKPLH